MKKELIKNIIKPFFKKHGFTNKGVNFYKDLEEFEIKANLQSQRYYKEENVEKFRINIAIYIKEFIQKTEKTFPVYGRFIPQNSDWIEISAETNYETLVSWLDQTLINTYDDILKKADFQVLKDLYQSDIYDYYHLFFLKKITPKAHRNWLEQMQNSLNEIQERKILLQAEEEKQKQRKDCLDKQVRLEGIGMKFLNLKHEEEKINMLLSVDKKITF